MVTKTMFGVLAIAGAFFFHSWLVGSASPEMLASLAMLPLLGVSAGGGVGAYFVHSWLVGSASPDVLASFAMLPLLGVVTGDGVGEWEPQLGGTSSNGGNGASHAAPPPTQAAQKAKRQADKEARLDQRRAKREAGRAKRLAEREAIKEEKRIERDRRRRIRMPLSSFAVFLPCIILDFFPALIHGRIYQEVIAFGETQFVSGVPVLGQIANAIDPNLTIAGVLTLVMVAIVLLSPVFFFLAWNRLNFAEEGWDALDEDPMALARLALPLTMYLGALGLEVWTIMRRLELEANQVVVFKVAGGFQLDPEILAVTAALTFLATTTVGYWASTKLAVFLEEKKARVAANPYVPPSNPFFK